ncbi:MAG TPA: hypothetical protein VFD49_23230 [Candidatus Dormibacteraeota bacterium]|nr:hypothetical protein [Candidatus Dormibacteraeota bacterium]
MCTVFGETEALVCDVALGRVLWTLDEGAMLGVVELEPVEGRGTWVRCRGAAGRRRFRELVEEAIAAAQVVPDG